MFCGQCGKRVLDTMLFCPFCGVPIVIPEQEDVPEVPAPADAPEAQAGELERTDAQETSEADEPFAPEPEAEADFEPLRFDDPEPEQPSDPEPEPAERFVSLFDEDPTEEEETFAPLIFDEEETESADSVLEESAGEEPPARIIPLEDPPRMPPTPAKRRPGGGSRRSNQTFIPVKNVDPDDMFMDNSHPERRDEYDPYDDGDDDSFGDDFDFEEPERGSFVQRHIRGVVGLILLLVLLIICLIWAIMPKGQQLLATANLAWNAETYNDLGYESYEAGQYHQAATYFERALVRDASNYEYAHSAMVAYYEAGETESALAMLKKCIEMRPSDPEPYHEALILYPDAAARPWEVQELLRLGYVRTGDEALNIGGE